MIRKLRSAVQMAVVAGTFAVGVAGAASASQVTFDFTGNGGLFGPSSYDDTTGTKSVDVSGILVYSNTGNTYKTGATVGQWSNGLGVCSSIGWWGKTAYCKEDHEVDGKNGNEVILFGFGEMVKILGATFSYIGSKDDVSYGDYSSGPNPTGWTYADIKNNGTFNFGGVMSSVFGIGAVDNNDNWKLKTLTVEYTDAAVIPLPAAGWLLLGGIGGLAALRRRKTAA